MYGAGIEALSAAQDATITGDWTFSGAVVFSGSVTSSSVIQLPDGAVGAPALTWSAAGQQDVGRYRIGADNVGEAVAGALVFDWNATRLQLASALALAWSTDLTLYRDAADISAQRRGVNAQAQRWYNTYTDASNYERVTLGFFTNVAKLLTAAAGTGTLRALTIGGNLLNLSGDAGVTSHWALASTGHLTAAGAYNITTTGLGTFGTALISAAAPTLTLYDTDAALNDKRWAWSTGALTLSLALDTDAGGAGTACMVVTRTTGTNTAASIAFTTTAMTTSGTLGVTGNITATAAAPTSGSGTGLTVNNTAAVRRVVHKVTVTYAALAAAGLTADKTIATLPAKTRLVGIVADTTVAYTGGGVTAASIIVGTSVGGAELVATHDVFSGATTKGLADADLGTSMVRSAAVLGGVLPSWSATTDVSVRLTTVTANTDQLTAGSTTYYLVTEVYP